MITLYVKDHCRHSKKALDALEELGVQFTEKNIKDPLVLAELMERGGKRQVPFLDDDNMTPLLVDDDVEMYESDDIVKYLTEKFAVGSTEVRSNLNVNLHVVNDEGICEACE